MIKKIFLSILPFIDNGIDKNESKILKERIKKDLTLGRLWCLVWSSDYGATKCSIALIGW